MVQVYNISNRTRTGPRTDGNGYTILKRKPSASIPERKENEESCPIKNDDRYPYDKRNADTITKLNLPKLEKANRETGGTILNVTGMNRFYYLRHFHDMRCKYMNEYYHPSFTSS